MDLFVYKGENDMEREREVLEMFLNKSVTSSRSVMREFSKLEGAVVHLPKDRGGFVYVPGTREDRVLLIARADTVWDSVFHLIRYSRQKVEFKDGCYFCANGKTGVGANNRAGCALVYLLRDLGHSILVLDRQQYGYNLGVLELEASRPDLFSEMNRHRYMMEFDLEGGDAFRYYAMLASDEFKNYLSEGFGYHEIPCEAMYSTDVCRLAQRICGVNVSLGCYNENTAEEKLDYSQWLNTYTKARNLLSKEQPHFEEYWIHGIPFDEN